MINSNTQIDSSSMNTVEAVVRLYNGDTVAKTCSCSDYLQSFTVDRIGEENKFFGFGVCQKITVNLIDLQREINIDEFDTIAVQFSSGNVYTKPYPEFTIEEVTWDEDANTITLVGYDKLYYLSKATLADITLNQSYTIADVATAIGNYIGASRTLFAGYAELSAQTSYENGANFDGTETLRQVLDAIAEVTQSIYLVWANGWLVFQQLWASSDPVLTITKNDYFTLKTGESVTLEAVCHATELGDNILVGTEGGVTQYVRDNPFLELRDDAATLLENAMVSGLTLTQFICEDWVGNYLLEIGDKIALETEDGNTVISYVLNDSITFDGTLSETTQWTYEPNDTETATNPISLGETINQTRARVDKANREISLVAGRVDGNDEAISSLILNTESITASVSSVKSSTEEALGAINDNFETLSQQVSAKMSAEDVQITIETEISKGANKVQTSTGFTFNEEGLNISKTGSEMTTQITEDGMTIARSGQETLVADNTGVRAENLHATTYLILGNTSRIEDWNGRSACFWIGG